MNLCRALIGSALLPLVASCGSSPFTVNGTINGSSLKPGDAVSALGAVAGAVASDSIPFNAAAVVLSNSSGLCASASSGKEPKSSQFLTLGLNDHTGNSPPSFFLGTYTVWPLTGPQPAKFVVVQYTLSDANCLPVQSDRAISGTVTITSIGNGDVSGNFDLTFDSGDHVSGSFSPKNCYTLFALLGNSTCG